MESGFTNPIDNEPSFSVLAQDIGDEDITLNNSHTPEPVLASTAHKDRANRDLIHRNQNLSGMAGSYMETEEERTSDLGADNNFQFLDFLKNSNSPSAYSNTPKSSLTSNKSKCDSFIDMDMMRDSASLLHVDSNLSLGSWLGDILPQDQQRVIETSQLDVTLDKRDVIPGMSMSDKTSDNECSTLASRYFLSQSQLPQNDRDSPSPGAQSLPSSNEHSMQQTTAHTDVYHSKYAAMDSQRTSTPPDDEERYDSVAMQSQEDEKEENFALNFSGVEYENALHMQQEIFGSEEFLEDAAGVLDKDEEIFEEENKLLIHSGEEVADVTESGFSALPDSPFCEYDDPKMSIGAYMAARSEKMGYWGADNMPVERPSFGMKIRTPSPRKPYPLIPPEDIQETYIVGDVLTDIGENGNNRPSDHHEASHDITLTEGNEKNKSENSSIGQQNEESSDLIQDVTIEPSMLSLSEAIMNMSTSVNNEELARAIIEISKKKKREKMMKKELQYKMSKKISSEESGGECSASKHPDHKEESKSNRRGSKIPVGTKPTSPPKPVRMSYSKRQSVPKKGEEIKRSPDPMIPSTSKQKIPKDEKEKPKQRFSVVSKVKSVPATTDTSKSVGRTSGSFMSKPDRPEQVKPKTEAKPTPLRSVENMADFQRQKSSISKGGKITKETSLPPDDLIRNDSNTKLSDTNSEFSAKSRDMELELTNATVPSKGCSDPKTWLPILQESFMQDTPEHDDIVEKSASEQEELPTFNNGRESVCFPDEVSSKYLLSSTRSDLSLTRGSLSRESIEELHKKLRIRGPRTGNDVPDKGSSQDACIGKELSNDIGKPETKESAKNSSQQNLGERNWKLDESRQSLQPLSQSSPDGKTSSSSRYSGEFHQMMPSMSFAEMATIPEHEFDYKDLEDHEEPKENLPQVPKLEVIQEEAETTQDTIISVQSSASGDSQLPSEISQDQILPHQTQHSIPPHMPMMHHPPHMYPPMQNVMYRHPASMSSASIPGPYPGEMHYRTMEGPYHVPSEFMGRVPPQVYPHTFNYPMSSSFAHHPVLHSTTTPMGYPLEQPSMASNADLILNHTTNTMYAPGSFHHPGMTHGPRSSSIDGRFHSFPETYFHQQHRRVQPASDATIFVPSELVFPSIRCVSLLSHAKLPLVNKTDRWIQVELNIISPAIDCCFSLDSKPLVGPHDTKNVEISFAAKKEGRFEALVEVISYPVTTEGAMLQSARSTPSMVNIRAVAENACAEIQGPDNQHELNFGDVLCDTSKCLPLRLLNKGSCEIPVCIVLCSKSQDRQCFAISESSSLECTESDKRSKAILRTMLPPGDQKMTVWVHCRMPPKHCDAAEPPKNISGQVYMEIDNAQKQSLDTILLDSISVEVVACVAKLHAPKSMQPLTFSCPRESSQTHTLPVKNCGNVSSRVSFSLADHSDVISVTPAHALLAAGEHVQLSVRFQPVRFTSNRFNSTLLMTIEPNGTKYEVMIVANCIEPELSRRGHGSSSRQSLTTDNTLSLGEMPSLLTNKSHICWGGVAVGRSLQQRVVLRTSSGARKPLPMRVMLKGEDSSCFQILCEDDRDREELCSRMEMTMRAGQDKIIRILFGPTKCRMALAKLEIKAPVDQAPSTKFTIPLSGYGGRSEVKVEDLESIPKESESSVEQFAAFADDVTDKTCDPRKSRMQVKFVVTNNSSRDAFVKAVFYSDKDCQNPLIDGVTGCTPSQFVLPKRNARAVTLTLQTPVPSSDKRTGYSRNGRDFIACVCLWHGDEVARHLLKSALSKLGPSAINKSLSESNPLRNVSFDGIFEGEGSNKLDEDLSQVKPQHGDVQVFYTSIRKTIIQVFGPRNDKPLFQMVEAGRKGAVRPGDDDGRNNEVQTHQHYRRTNQLETNEDESWDMSPDHVVLSAPRPNSLNEPSKIKLINRSGSTLRFDVSWSGHYLTITPHSGQVDPESVLVVLLNANPSLASRRDLLPWLGTVQVSALDGRGTKQLRVQIRDDVEPLDASVQPATPVPCLPLKAQYSELPSSDSFATPLSTSGPSRVAMCGHDGSSKQILLNSTVIDFGKAVVKSSSKSHLEFTNISSNNIRWLLTSFAPAYVKDVEPTGDLYRSTYAAFVFSHTSGLLESGAKVKIPVSFNPMSDGNYSQFWDLEHHEAADSAAMSLNKIRIQLIAQGIKSAKPPSQMSNVNAASKNKESGIYVSEDTVKFPDVTMNDSTIVKIPVKNRSKDSHSVRFINVRPPFHITHQRHTIRPMSYACLPVTFKPTSKGKFEGTLVIQTEGSYNLAVKLLGNGI